MGPNKELTDALSASIHMEEEGRKFYLAAAKRSRNEFGKRIFESLADDETRHIIAIKEYCESLEKKNKTPNLCAAMPRHKNIKERLIFGRRESELLKGVKPDADELEAYKIGIDMENEGYKFYKKTLDSVSDPNTKDLYKFLLSEEEAHHDLLSNTYEYLKNPRAWFAKEEKPIVEG